MDQLLYGLGLLAVGAPVFLLAAIGLPAMVGKKISERTTNHLIESVVVTGLLSSLVILGVMLSTGHRRIPIILGNWVLIHGYHFLFKFEFDRLSVPFVILTYMLCGTIAAFCSRYMHRERGYDRFFIAFAIFLLGMVVTSLSGTIETLFFGWEFVGLSSALLVAFYQERPAPVRNGLWVWTVYRISDAALLLASIALHHLRGAGDFDQLLGDHPWPEGAVMIPPDSAFLVGALLLLAAAGKSALVPFSGWLPRAMEGPTPSSAVYYGALSVHLGAFLLLRVSPVLDASPVLSYIVVVLGIITALFASFVGRVQTDIKCALTYASLTQVGIIVAEIGVGWRYFPLIHILGHGCYRTLQFLRAPTLLHDYRIMENAIGDHLPRRPSWWTQLLPERMRLWLYRFALERGYLDALLFDYMVTPFLRLLSWCNNNEIRWTRFLAGETKPVTPPSESYVSRTEELT